MNGMNWITVAVQWALKAYIHMYHLVGARLVLVLCVCRRQT
jgi:hypothetical protein